MSTHIGPNDIHQPVNPYETSGGKEPTHQTWVRCSRMIVKCPAVHISYLPLSKMKVCRLKCVVATYAPLSANSIMSCGYITLHNFGSSCNLEKNDTKLIGTYRKRFIVKCTSAYKGNLLILLTITSFFHQCHPPWCLLNLTSIYWLFLLKELLLVPYLWFFQHHILHAVFLKSISHSKRWVVFSKFLKLIVEFRMRERQQLKICELKYSQS